MGDESDILKRPVVLTANFSWLAVSDQGVGSMPIPCFLCLCKEKTDSTWNAPFGNSSGQVSTCHLDAGARCLAPGYVVIWQRQRAKSPDGMYATLSYVGESRSSPHHFSMFPLSDEERRVGTINYTRTKSRQP